MQTKIILSSDRASHLQLRQMFQGLGSGSSSTDSGLHRWLFYSRAARFVVFIDEAVGVADALLRVTVVLKTLVLAVQPELAHRCNDTKLAQHKILLVARRSCLSMKHKMDATAELFCDTCEGVFSTFVRIGDAVVRLGTDGRVRLTQGLGQVRHRLEFCNTRSRT